MAKVSNSAANGERAAAVAATSPLPPPFRMAHGAAARGPRAAANRDGCPAAKARGRTGAEEKTRGKETGAQKQSSSRDRKRAGDRAERWARRGAERRRDGARSARPKEGGSWVELAAQRTTRKDGGKTPPLPASTAIEGRRRGRAKRMRGERGPDAPTFSAASGRGGGLAASRSAGPPEPEPREASVRSGRKIKLVGAGPCRGAIDGLGLHSELGLGSRLGPSRENRIGLAGGC